MSRHERRLRIRCDLCRGSLKRGHLWLGGSDYVECPQCLGSGQVDVIEARLEPGHQIAVSGLRDQALLTVHPHRAAGPLTRTA